MLARWDGFPVRIGRCCVSGVDAQPLPSWLALARLPWWRPWWLLVAALVCWWLLLPGRYLPWLVAGPGALAGWLLPSLVGWLPCLRGSTLSRAGTLANRSTHPPGGSVLVNIFPATQTSLSFLIISFYPFFECGVDLH